MKVGIKTKDNFKRSIYTKTYCITGKRKKCSHVQAFDVSQFVKTRLFQRDVYYTNKSKQRIKKDRWLCPVCDKKCPIGDVYIDGFWQEILSHSSTVDANHVFLYPDCTYEVEKEVQEEASDSDGDDDMSNKPSKSTKSGGSREVVSLLS
eukprot:UN27278